MEWFVNAKYGTFIHWGLYAIPGGDWQGKHIPHGTEWIMRNARIPFVEYRKLAEQFNPALFDAEEWVQRIRDYGAKYLCVTAKHHDGFAMFHSRVSDFTIERTPFGRDAIKEIADACRKYGMRFCVYYSQMQDWADPDGNGNDWDFEPDQKVFSRYFYGKALPQITELLTNYGDVGMIWFDTPYDMPVGLCEELRRHVKSLQPDCLINGRIGYGLGDYRQMSDNCIPLRAYPHPWETPMTLNDTWGYSHSDHHWKTEKDVIGKLADVAAKGGNLLLNVGPDALGRIPAESDRILLNVGQWLSVNGESVYGTGASAEMTYETPWGVCTTRPGHLYLHVLRYPREPFILPITNLKIQIRHIKMLGSGQTLTYAQTYEAARNEDRLRIFLPSAPPDQDDAVIDIAFTGEIKSVPLDMP